MSVIKKHRLHLNTPDHASIKNAIMKIKETNGIVQVDGPDNKNRIRIQYDLEKINWKTIEASLTAMNLLGKRTIMDRLLDGIRYDMEQNELDNLHTPSLPCCSNPKLKN